MSIPVNFSIGAILTTNVVKLQACNVTTLVVEHETSLVPSGGSYPAQNVSLFLDESKVYIVQLVEFQPAPFIHFQDNVDVSKLVFQTEPDIVWVVDRSVNDPVNNTDIFYDPNLTELSNYRLVKRGEGPLEPGVEFDYVEYPLNPGTYGVQLLQGRLFNASDTYTLEFFSPGTSTPRDMFLRVGRGLAYDPLTGTAQYRYSPLAGKNYRVEKRGYGAMRTDEITIAAAGGWDLLLGAIFNFDDTWIIHFYPSIIIQTPNNSSPGKWFDGMTYITAVSTAYDVAHIGKLLRFSPAGSTCEYVLPLGATMPANKMLCFEHVGGGGTALMGTISTSGGQDIEFHWNGLVVLHDKIWIGKNEQVYIQWDSVNTKWVIVMANWGINDVGSFVDAYVQLPNTHPCAGVLKARNLYPRLIFILDQFMPGVWINDADWTGAEIGKFSKGDGSTTFRFPDWTSKTAYAGSVGQYQADQVGEFTLDPISAKSTAHGGASSALNGNNIKLLVNNAVDEGTITIKGSNTIQQAGKETRVKRIGIMKLVRT